MIQEKWRHIEASLPWGNMPSNRLDVREIESDHHESTELKAEPHVTRA